MTVSAIFHEEEETPASGREKNPGTTDVGDFFAHVRVRAMAGELHDGRLCQPSYAAALI